MTWLSGMFAIVAFIYASVGFGGGSTYTALLALSETDYQLLPVVSLTCNLIVVVGGVLHFSRAGYIPWARALPICTLSVPLAWLGGRITLPETMFIGLLSLSLLMAGSLLLFDHRFHRRPKPLSSAVTPIPAIDRPSQSFLEMMVGGVIGFLSGLVGIGGGIFLSPVLLLLHWSTARIIAGTASLFILLNSCAGMIGQLQKLGGERIGDITSFWPLFLAVIIGGQVGSRSGVGILPEIWMKRLTAILVLFVGLRLLQRFFSKFEMGLWL